MLNMRLENVETLYLMNREVSEVSTVRTVIEKCSSLAVLDKHFTTSNLIDFRHLHHLSLLHVHIDTELNDFFYQCTQLEHLTIEPYQVCLDSEFCCGVTMKRQEEVNILEVPLISFNTLTLSSVASWAQQSEIRKVEELAFMGFPYDDVIPFSEQPFPCHQEDMRWPLKLRPTVGFDWVQDDPTKGRIEWIFITPRAPWVGGYWERLIRSEKTALKVLGKALVSENVQTTLLCETEARINARPLTFVSDGVNDVEPLTPFHFLTGRRFQEVQTKTTNENVGQLYGHTLRKKWCLQQTLLSHLWKRWRQIHRCSKRTIKMAPLKERTCGP
ncbi:hypothetical protein M514_24703 [Trichuris suis]|uniref:Uncharacterized protein n=1 Tax=Trichuris suis TaxID=68888 RepID=A0A085N0X0_9BILA|nr:hypothetical protein M514_24703 [Trichuris suis]